MPFGNITQTWFIEDPASFCADFAIDRNDDATFTVFHQRFCRPAASKDNTDADDEKTRSDADGWRHLVMRYGIWLPPNDMQEPLSADAIARTLGLSKADLARTLELIQRRWQQHLEDRRLAALTAAAAAENTTAATGIPRASDYATSPDLDPQPPEEEEDIPPPPPPPPESEAAHADPVDQADDEEEPEDLYPGTLPPGTGAAMKPANAAAATTQTAQAAENNAAVSLYEELQSEKTAPILARAGFHHVPPAYRSFVATRILELQRQLQEPSTREQTRGLIQLEIELRTYERLGQFHARDLETVLSQSRPDRERLAEIRNELAKNQQTIVKLREQHRKIAEEIGADEHTLAEQKHACIDQLSYVFEKMKEYQADPRNALTDGVFTAEEIDWQLTPLELTDGIRAPQYRIDIVLALRQALETPARIFAPNYQHQPVPRQIVRDFLKIVRQLRDKKEAEKIAGIDDIDATLEADADADDDASADIEFPDESLPHHHAPEPGAHQPAPPLEAAAYPSIPIVKPLPGTAADDAFGGRKA